MATSIAAAQDVSPAYEHLKDLEVFVGSWEGTTTLPVGAAESEKLGKLAGAKVTLTLTTRWAPGKCAQITEYDFRIEGSEPILGASLLGWDQVNQEIRFNQFTTQTGTWAGVTKRTGTNWIEVIEGYNLDRLKRTGKRVTRFIDKDHFVTTETEQMLDGKPQPDIVWNFVRK
jgi:hypothetical protein